MPEAGTHGPNSTTRPTCTVTVHPCGGDAVTVATRDFASAEEATSALRAALDGGAAFTIGIYHPDDPTAAATLTLHPANIALVQVHAASDATTGQYL